MPAIDVVRWLDDQGGRVTSALDDLLGLVPPPAGARPAVDWPAVDWPEVERALGVRLPADYKGIVEAYGPGQFDDFLTLYQPATRFLTIDLAYQAENRRAVLAQLLEDLPYAPEELLPVAGTDNGDIVYWVLEEPADPESWTITGNEARHTSWPRFDGGLAEFLYAVLSRRLSFPIFPDGFPSPAPRFQPQGAPDPALIARLRTQGLYR
jgi:hypothetical protein